MAFEQKPNSGALFTNRDKRSQNHPDFRGDLHLDKTFLIQQMDKSKGALVKISISAWQKTAASGTDYMSLSASEPYVKPSSSKEDLPY
jgi:uncharacterized protein (DUF736 family)